MAGSTRHDRVAKLLEVAGATLSEQAGIRLQKQAGATVSTHRVGKPVN
jgi:hypothetical protein